MGEPGQEYEPVHLSKVAVPVRRLHWRSFAAAALMGAIGAAAAALVRFSFMGLEWIFTRSVAPPPVAGAHLEAWRRALVPMAGGLLAMGVLFLRQRRAKTLARQPRDYVEYVEAVRRQGGRIPFVPNCWRTASAAFSVATGASVGREGSMIQFAAAVTSAAGEWLRRWLGGAEPMELSLLVAFGVSGGVVTAYNTPAAAVFFAAEIVLGGLELRELLLLAVSSGAGWLVSGSVQGTTRLYPAHASLAGAGWQLAWLPLLAVLFGLLGPWYQKLIRGLRAARGLPLALAWSGLLVGVASVLDPRVWGNGDLGITAALGSTGELRGLAIGVPAIALLLGLRLLATTVCVGTGTVGGVFTPTLFAGAATGALVVHLLPHPAQVLYAIAGMSLLMAAVTHAPLMAAFMAVELTGDWQLLPILLPLNVISWQVARRISGQALYAIASQAPAHGSSAVRLPRRGARDNGQRTV